MSRDVASVAPLGVSNGNCATPVTVNGRGGSACSWSVHDALSTTREPGSSRRRLAVFSLITSSAPVPISRPRRMLHGCAAVPATPWNDV